jgi:hypothetical protein
MRLSEVRNGFGQLNDPRFEGNVTNATPNRQKPQTNSIQDVKHLATHLASPFEKKQLLGFPSCIGHAKPFSPGDWWTRGFQVFSMKDNAALNRGQENIAHLCIW